MPSRDNKDVPNVKARPPPTLRPFLENLPSPGLAQSEQATPKAAHGNAALERSTPTPTRATFFLNSREDDFKDHDEDESRPTGVDQEDDDTLEDDEFEAHYSQRSSPASPAQSPQASEDEDEYPEAPSTVQRVNSVPVTSHASHVPSQLHTSQSMSTLPPLPPPPLYPPFYNRPPTPLPPSPSLTSLLRPPSLLNRSTASTRPTTPDSSDVETPNDTEAAVAHSARRAHPLPPTAPKVPTYEYYGFVLYLASSLAFLMYLLWSYLPSPFLHALGVTYYPNRWWSLAIPAWIVMVLVFIYTALLSYNVEYLTLPMASLECIVDEAGSVALLDEHGKMVRGGSKRFVRDMEQRRTLEEQKDHKYGSWGKKNKASKVKRPRIKDRDSDWYGYLGEPKDGDFGLNWRHVWTEGTDAVMDIPLGGVCEVLYGDARDIP